MTEKEALLRIIKQRGDCDGVPCITALCACPLQRKDHTDCSVINLTTTQCYEKAIELYIKSYKDIGEIAEVLL